LSASTEDARREAHVVETRTHGRFRMRTPSGPARGILVGFHGYTEDAEKHLADLESIPGLEDWALVAVDALHAFYARSSGSGRVVRGWMTRDLRQEAIADNVRYVRLVFERLRTRFGWRLPLATLGFSQGASMAWRAALLAGHEVAAVIALAGDIPPELADLPASTPFPPHALLARGAGDEWYSAEKLAGDRRLLAPRATEVEELVFDGGHEWSDRFRDRAAARLVSARG